MPAFFVLTFFGSDSPATASLFVIYGAFGAAAGSPFFTGVYVLIGAGRGWITLEVLKAPWAKLEGK